ncbi:UNVERIFIED_CONTAM: hypothetical protein GTU68_060446 [Idotea baltica]|nr:hypothetical protein [Idotea baltica]
MASKEGMHNTIQIPSIFPSSNFGKLKRRVVAYAPADPPFLEVEARLGATKLKFIVDSGTSVSIAPSHYLNVIVLDPTTVTLSSATRNSIPCLGQAKLQIQIPKFRRAFLWTFKVAETVHPLLGFDFINNFGLIIDCKNKQLRDTTTDLTVNVQFSPSSLNVVINKIEIPTIVEDVIKDYPSLTSPHVNHDAHIMMFIIELKQAAIPQSIPRLNSCQKRNIKLQVNTSVYFRERESFLLLRVNGVRHSTLFQKKMGNTVLSIASPSLIGIQFPI